jgi:phosphate/sulfate permease
LSVERLLLVTVVVALAFDFTNGAHDAANAIRQRWASENGLMSPALF